MRILFLFIGEPHQLFHALPIAAELERVDPGTEIEIAITSDDHATLIARVAEAYPGFTARVTRLAPPLLGRLFKSMLTKWSQMRLPTLLAALPYLRNFDAIVVPERTTTAIKPLLETRTRLIFTPHGAGDRAITIDRRDRNFDFVLVAGGKSERRMLDAGTIRPGDYAVNGYVKLDMLDRLEKRATPLFTNGRPTVLYAPHFRRTLSSWERFAAPLIAAFAAQDRYNLVVAPHLRLFHDATARQKARWERLAIPGRLIVDLGSLRSTDMSYTAQADLFVGDVSSQVYEYLARPRPCLFLNGHGVKWRDDPNYLFWELGEVIEDPTALMSAVARAADLHPGFVDRQQEVFAASVGDDPRGAAARGAVAILDYLRRDDAGRMAAGLRVA